MNASPSLAKSGLVLLLTGAIAASAQGHELVAYLENRDGGFAKLWGAYVAYDSGHHVAENGVYVEESDRRGLVPWEHVLHLALRDPGEPTRWEVELRDGTRLVDYYSANGRDGRIYVHGTNRYGFRDAYYVDPLDYETHGIVAIHLRREEEPPQDATELSEVTAGHPLRDALFLLNTDVVEGAVLNRTFHLQTGYGRVALKSTEIAEIIMDTERAHILEEIAKGRDEGPLAQPREPTADKVLLRSGERLSGILETDCLLEQTPDPCITVETPQGTRLALLFPELVRIAFRSR